MPMMTPACSRVSCARCRSSWPEIKPKGETTVVALANGVTLRLLDLPLSDPKKVQLALPFELAGQLMTDLDDQVVDQTLISVGSPQPGGGEAPSQWVAACAPRDELHWMLQTLLAQRIEPRRVAALAPATAPLFITPPRARGKGLGRHAGPGAADAAVGR